LKPGTKQAGKTHTQTRFIKINKGSWEDELFFGKTFGTFWSNNTLMATSVDRRERYFKDRQHYITQLFANIGFQ